MIDKETIDKIFDTARIEEVISDFVHLKKSGSSYKGLSPFGNEKTPSFMVSPSKGIWKDFSSGKGGNVVSFVMEHEQMNYPEALRYLAGKYNIEIAEKEQTPEEQIAANSRESLYLVNAFAEKYFSGQLHETEAGRAIGLSYFKERGFHNDVIKKFGLGYNPDQWDAFTNSALGAGYQLEFLQKAGLIKIKGERKYDFFKGRILFPIHNLTGRPIGFGARTLKTDKQIPKYLNSPETEVYNKSKLLYGIYQAKREIVKKDNCYLVEGYTDVISLHQAGIENVVASSGTALTREQIRLIRRYTDNITILYDGDAAGIRASFRGIDLVLEEGMNVKVVLFPNGEDPDSFSQKHSISELTEFLKENTKDFIVFKTDLLITETQNDPIKRASLVHEIVNSIALIPDLITRQVYMQECSRIMEMPEQTLIHELNKVRRKNIQKQHKASAGSPSSQPPLPHNTGPEKVPDLPFEAAKQTKTGLPQPADRLKTPAEKNNRIAFQENDVVRILLNYGHYLIPVTIFHEEDQNREEEIEMPVAHYVVLTLETDAVRFQNQAYQKILEYYAKRLEKDEESIPSPREMIHHEDPEVAQVAAHFFTEKYMLADWKRKQIYVTSELIRLKATVFNAIYSLKLAHIEKRIDEIQEQLRENPEDQDVEHLLRENLRWLESKKRLSKELGRIVVR